jgi:hypothetical protein
MAFVFAGGRLNLLEKEREGFGRQEMCMVTVECTHLQPCIYL